MRLGKLPIRLILVLVIVTASAGSNAQKSSLLTQEMPTQYNFTSFTAQEHYSNQSKLLTITPVTFTHNPDFGKSFLDGKLENGNIQWYEKISERTLKSRTYVDINNTAHVLIQYGYDNLNYLDENGWLRAVDLKLKPSANGWSAIQQENPTYLYSDGSTALSIGNGQVMLFNKNVKFNSNSILTAHYTVGDNGMYIKNVIDGTDKIIRFGRGMIETDYRINKPLKLSGDLIISEDIILPGGYTISENKDNGSLIVNNTNNKSVAEIKAPLCYDNNRNSVTGSYRVQKRSNGYTIELTVPSSWLNFSSLQYPLTIDPIAITVGPTAVWSGGKIGSCFETLGHDTLGEDTGIIYVTIPGGITATDLFVQIGTYAALVEPDSTKLFFTDGCANDTIFAGDTSTKVNTFEHLNNIDFLKLQSTFLNCFVPSCTPTVVPLKVALVRRSGGTDCDDTLHFYYDPNNNFGFPYQAYVEGYEDETETSGAGWNITPNPTCGNDCTLKLSSTTINGVPPYTITHPWSGKSVTYGKYIEGTATSTGVIINYLLAIPNCPIPVCNTTGITVPPPVIVDACNDTVTGLTPITLNFNPVPNVTINSTIDSICSDSNISISLGSCINNPIFNWTSSLGATGQGGLVNAPVNNGTVPDTVTYTVTATSDSGCVSSPSQTQVIVDPLPVVIINPASPFICANSSIELTANGAVSYTWSPSAGLSASTGDSVAASSPGNNYTITGTNIYGCIGKGTVAVSLAPQPVITVSPPSTTVCAGSNTTLTAQGASTYTWHPSTGLNVTNDSIVSVTTTITTTYTVVGVDSFGCIDSTTVVVTLDTLPQVSFFVTVPSTCNPQRVQFLDTLPGSFIYAWNFGDSTTGALFDPIHNYAAAGVYKIKLTVTDASGCSDTASAEDTVLATGFLAVPNAFAPQGNNANDNYFMPHMLCPDYSGYTFNIYSRWGQLLFQTNDTNVGWDGTYNALPEQTGVYVYYIKFNCGNCPFIKQGNITLLR